MITEDYVSFETAKLLKEKGFKSLTKMVYRNPNDPFIHNKKEELIPNQYDIKEGNICEILAPTHQMAMKWLREKGVYMSTDAVIPSSGGIYFNIYTYSKDSGWNHPVDFYDSYEEAVEASIKYCLENLIKG